MERADITIVGAGVVGLAAAARLARPERTVVVLERHPRYGVETSSRNSEVIHAGLYYPPESLKSRLCHAGRRRLYALAEEAGVFVRKTGKFVVATAREELGRLEEILKRGQESGAEGLELVGSDEVSRRVPFVRALAALWSPESGIVDSEELMRHFFDLAEARGALFVFGAALAAAERKPEGWKLRFGLDEELLSRVVVNCAGLHADKVAALAGLDPAACGLRVHWCKGVYFRYFGVEPLRQLVYPVPVKHGLGIHLTPDREGRIRLGPDTEFVAALDYAVPEERAQAFRDSAARYWPGLSTERLFPDTAGIRPKLTGPEGGFRDFVIREESANGCPGWINLAGIESPGLTASPAIADEIAALAEPLL